MPYWTLNKETNKAGVFTNLKILAEVLNIDSEKLYYHFSRKKQIELNSENLRIVKVEQNAN